jgi:hypothetical protein
VQKRVHACIFQALDTHAFWLSTPTACGLVVTDAIGVVLGGCPYFVKAYRGKRLNDVVAGIRRQGREAKWARIANDGLVVLVTGGRDYRDRDEVWRRLDLLRERHGVRLLIEGGATGADRLAREWAKARGVAWHTEEARWSNAERPGAVVRRRRDGTPYDAAAGGVRNQRMAEMAPDVCCEFPGGTGTADCVGRVKGAGVALWPAAAPAPPPLAHNRIAA